MPTSTGLPAYIQRADTVSHLTQLTSLTRHFAINEYVMLCPVSQLLLAEFRRQQKLHISETLFQQLVQQRLLLIDWRLSRTKQPLWCTARCDVPSQRSANTPRDKSAAVRALPVFLNQTCWFLLHGNAGCAEGTADTVI